MKNKTYPWQKNEQGFLILLVCAAIFGLVTLLSGFVMPMIFAAVISCACYPLYKYFYKKTKMKSLSSSVVVTSVAIVVLFPLSYVISVGTSTAYELYQNNQEQIANMNFDRIDEIKKMGISYLPIDEDKQKYLGEQINQNAKVIFNQLKDFLIGGTKSAIDNSVHVIYFLGLTLFSMFFFFKGGDKIVDKVKKITPLDDDFDDLIMSELYSLCGILTISVFSVAILQGVAFGILTYFMDLNWLFIAVAISITSFIPVFGTFLVWFPLSLFLLSTGKSTEAGLVFFWGVVVTGIIIDNIIRPIITGKVCKMFEPKSGELNIKDFNPLDNLYLIILSNIGGIMTFGVIGLFLGPIIVSISIAIFDLYIERIKAAANYEDKLYENVGDNCCHAEISPTLNNKEDYDDTDTESEEKELQPIKRIEGDI